MGMMHTSRREEEDGREVASFNEDQLDRGLFAFELHEARLKYCHRQAHLHIISVLSSDNEE
jgi:hypothetical protein